MMILFWIIIIAFLFRWAYRSFMTDGNTDGWSRNPNAGLSKIALVCPKCNQRYYISPIYAGRSFTCDSCSTIIPGETLQIKKAMGSSDTSHRKTPPNKNRTGASGSITDTTAYRPESRTPQPQIPVVNASMRDVFQNSVPPFTIDLLKQLEWKRFEEVTEAYFQCCGFRTELASFGPDGGIDIKLYSKHGASLVAVVQCKAWNKRQVGPKLIRELIGVMSINSVNKGFFVTSGVYNSDARKLEGEIINNTQTVKLIDGYDLVNRIMRLAEEDRKRIVTLATAGDYTTPTCPSCGRKLISRISKYGPFWSCPDFPRCRYKLNM